MAKIPGFLALAALVAGIVTFLVGVALGRGQAEVATLIYGGLVTLFLQVFAVVVTFVHARLLGEERAELLARIAAAGESRAESTDGETGGQ
jgi:mannose/fructose/N-acetylgalactosamine-specific phosphotransferase system component IID